MSAFDAALANLDAACQSTFGVQVTYQPTNGNPVPGVSAIKNTAVDEAMSTQTHAVLFFTAGELAKLPASPIEGDGVILESVQYSVFQVLFDGQGGCHTGLRLRP